jgi:hypothetical protein
MHNIAQQALTVKHITQKALTRLSVGEAYLYVETTASFTRQFK